MKLKLLAGGTVEVSDRAFGREFNEALIHQVITSYLAGKRQGTRAQRTRSEVSGGGRKPWRQKGTGRARAGTTRSPIWRSGGVTFAAKTQDHSQKVNKKMYRAAIKSILSELIRQRRLLVVKEFGISEPKTKTLVEKLSTFELTNVLIVSDEVSNDLYLSARNLPLVIVRDAKELDPVSLISCEKVLITVDALKVIEGQLS